MEKQRQRFGLRKLNVGVASVLLGTTFILGSGTIAHADNNATPQSNSDNELASDTQSNQQLQSKEFTLQSGTKNGGVASDTLTATESKKAVSDPTPTTQSTSKENSNVSSTNTISSVQDDTKQSTSETVAKMTKLDSSSFSVDVNNAKAGDTYSLVFRQDPHTTMSYTQGDFVDSTVAAGQTGVDKDHNFTYNVKYLKDGTTSQPFVINSDWNRSILNTPGTYHNYVDFYYKADCNK